MPATSFPATQAGQRHDIRLVGLDQLYADQRPPVQRAPGRSLAGS